MHRNRVPLLGAYLWKQIAGQITHAELRLRLFHSKPLNSRESSTPSSRFDSKYLNSLESDTGTQAHMQSNRSTGTHWKNSYDSHRLPSAIAGTSVRNQGRVNSARAVLRRLSLCGSFVALGIHYSAMLRLLWRKNTALNPYASKHPKTPKTRVGMGRPSEGDSLEPKQTAATLAAIPMASGKLLAY